ncbi:MAG: PAS domain S-box protein [Deltaproteobacteria bacterium]|nr:PAS domain S-box protein [Deltaproteobacteria bacterium]
MALGHQATLQHSPSNRLQWLMLLRVVFTTLLLGSTIAVQIVDQDSLISFPLLVLYGLIGGVYLLTFFYVLVLKRRGPSPAFTHAQIGVDTLFVTALIYVTGGIGSVFTFLYLVVIVYASILLYKRGSLIMASLCSLEYGMLIGLEYYGIINAAYTEAGPGAPAYDPSYVIYNVLITVMACFLVAFLSSHLAQQTARTEKELQAKQQDFRRLEAFNASIIQSMDSGLLTIDINGRISSFNTAAEAITGYQRQEVIGKPLGAIFPEIDQQYSPDIASDQRKPYRRDVVFRKKDSTEGYLGFSVSSLRGADGKTLGNLLIFQDLTALKIMESHIKRVERLAAVGEMAAGIAHEIKNPLASMSGSIQLLDRQIQMTPVTQKLMKIVLREADRLNTLVNDFLLFARPSSGRSEPVELEPALRETLELFEKDAVCRDRITVVRNLTRNIWTSMDPKHLRQIFWNLLLNAAQAINGHGTINVALSASDGTAMVKITDDGLGMSEQTQGQIFDPFFTTRPQGSGLGLSIVHRLLESCGGTIDVQSSPGRGSSFSVFLRTIDPPNTAPA